MKSGTAKAVPLAIVVLLLCGCASGPSERDLAMVSGCVEVIEAPPPGQCVIVEFHEFRPGYLWFAGSYVQTRRQPLSADGCFVFEAPAGRQVGIKTRDSDRILVGAAEYVVAGQSSTGLALVHGRESPSLDDGGALHCGNPAIETGE